MYPQFELFGITVYSFGLTLSVSFLAFFFLLYRLSLKIGINTNFFLGNALWFFLSSFVFSRLFYVISEWRDFQFIFSEGFFRFFFMSDYNFSLIGGIFGFLLVLFVFTKFRKLPGNKFIDAVSLAFLGAAFIGFIGAFLGGQILGAPTESALGISYPADTVNNPYTSPVLPLGLFYAVFSFALFCILYIVRTVVRVDGIIGYLAILLFSSAYLVGEEFSGRPDLFEGLVGASLAQIGFFLLILVAVR
ncbi:MAG TPA: prolipoprotein diacylglyceryl transferase [bacterium]|nr:prolipoprotein diacylglyceryl transferase [bacterium]